jgi:hypothetical protein
VCPLEPKACMDRWSLFPRTTDPAGLRLFHVLYA